MIRKRDQLSSLATPLCYQNTSSHQVFQFNIFNILETFTFLSLQLLVYVFFYLSSLRNQFGIIGILPLVTGFYLEIQISYNRECIKEKQGSFAKSRNGVIAYLKVSCGCKSFQNRPLKMYFSLQTFVSNNNHLGVGSVEV